jgi:hypothetical protein
LVSEAAERWVSKAAWTKAGWFSEAVEVVWVSGAGWTESGLVSEAAERWVSKAAWTKAGWVSEAAEVAWASGAAWNVGEEKRCFGCRKFQRAMFGLSNSQELPQFFRTGTVNCKYLLTSQTTIGILSDISVSTEDVVLVCTNRRYISVSTEDVVLVCTNRRDISYSTEDVVLVCTNRRHISLKILHLSHKQNFV